MSPTDLLLRSGTFNSGGGKPSPKNDLSSLLKRGRSERFVHIMDITPAIAASMLATSSGNRPISSAAVSKYATLMSAGVWKLTSEGIAFDRKGNLQNGHHRLHAIIESGETIAMTVWFGTDVSEFEYLDGGHSRTAGDLIALNGLDRWNIRASIARYILAIEHKTNDRLDRLIVTSRAIQMDSPEVSAAMLVGEAVRKIIPPSAAAFAYYWIIRESRFSKNLPEFFAILQHGIGDGNTRPVIRLRDFFLSGEYKASRNPIKLAAYIILAWNAYVSGKSAIKLQWASVTTLPSVQ
jgi:hypothetical protein